MMGSWRKYYGRMDERHGFGLYSNVSCGAMDLGYIQMSPVEGSLDYSQRHAVLHFLKNNKLLRFDPRLEGFQKHRSCKDLRHNSRPFDCESPASVSGSKSNSLVSQRPRHFDQSAAEKLRGYKFSKLLKETRTKFSISFPVCSAH
jgi:hypothetical protein